MKNLLYLIITSVLVSSCIVYQKGENGKPGSQGKNADETVTTQEKNKKLADSLGADERGMKTYMLVNLKTGLKDAEITDKTQRSELFKGHFSNMEAMEKAGKLKLAGPFATKNNLQYRGIFLIDAKTEEEVKTLLQGDPTIKNGIFEVEILPWWSGCCVECDV